MTPSGGLALTVRSLFLKPAYPRGHGRLPAWAAPKAPPKRFYQHPSASPHSLSSPKFLAADLGLLSFPAECTVRGAS